MTKEEAITEALNSLDAISTILDNLWTVAYDEGYNNGYNSGDVW